MSLNLLLRSDALADGLESDMQVTDSPTPTALELVNITNRFSEALNLCQWSLLSQIARESCDPNMKCFVDNFLYASGPAAIQALQERVCSYPPTYGIIKNVEVSVNELKGYAVVFQWCEVMNVEIPGQSLSQDIVGVRRGKGVGIKQPTLNVVKWRRVMGIWRCYRLETLRGIVGMGGTDWRKSKVMETLEEMNSRGASNH